MSKIQSTIYIEMFEDVSFNDAVFPIFLCGHLTCDEMVKF